MKKGLSTLQQLDLRLKDASRLLEIHTEVTGNAPGRRHGYDALNRSVILLVVGAWEAFCEDLAVRNAAALARRLKVATDLPPAIREPMIQWLYERNKMSSLNADARAGIWSLAGHGWREVYREYAVIQAKRLNTPNSDNVKTLFQRTIAINDITVTWRYRRWGSDVYIQKLDELLQVRHRIAHGTINLDTVGKTQASNAVRLVNMLASAMSSGVQAHFDSLDLQGRRAKILPA